MNRLFAAIGLLPLLSLATAQDAAPPAKRTAAAEPPEQRLERARPGVPAGKFTIRNGDPTDPQLYPAVLWFVKAGPCSGTLIGERTLITARHCVAPGARISVPHRIGSDRRVLGTCTHPGPDALTLDIALCLLDAPVQSVFENVNRNSARPQPREKVIIAGFGCGAFETPDVGVPTFRTGTTTVVRVPDAQSDAIVTRGGAALCLGDSGGATFLTLSSGVRLLVAVNSQASFDDVSFLPSVSSPTALGFIRGWAAERGQQICGLGGQRGCR